MNPIDESRTFVVGRTLDNSFFPFSSLPPDATYCNSQGASDAPNSNFRCFLSGGGERRTLLRKEEEEKEGEISLPLSNTEIQLDGESAPPLFERNSFQITCSSQ